jgi:quinol monooxygenase YgiN
VDGTHPARAAFGTYGMDLAALCLRPTRNLIRTGAPRNVDEPSAVSAKLEPMAVVAVAELFGIGGRRNELAGLLERFEGWAAGERGCRRSIVAATLADPSRFVLVSEWDSRESLDEHYKSEGFANFQLDLDGLLARPSELTIYSAEQAVRPVGSRPMDPRDAD